MCVLVYMSHEHVEVNLTDKAYRFIDYYSPWSFKETERERRRERTKERERHTP